MTCGYKTSLGQCLCGDSSVLLDQIEDKSINLVVTSPPFALQRKKAYGNESQTEYVNWLRTFAKKVFQKLTDDGSFVIDIGGAYAKGEPTYSLYQFRTLLMLCDDIGFKLAQPFYWHNPSALPSPIEWVNKRKLRVKSSVNTVWWLCKDPFCKSNVANVLTPYSSRMIRLISKPEDFIKADIEARPSGHIMSKKSWCKNNGGAIPSNLLQISNSESNTQYQRLCKLLGIHGHPARFPSALPTFFVKLLTDKGDTVLDIFSGSNTVGATAESLGRKWISFEQSKEYVANSVLRFCSSEQEAKIHFERIINGEFVDISLGLF